MRSQAEIIAQCEARMLELEAHAQSPAVQRTCSTCKWRDKIYTHYCHEPIMKGFSEKPLCTVDWLRSAHISHQRSHMDVALCGHEKALWKPREEPEKPRSWRRRLIAAILKGPTNAG